VLPVAAYGGPEAGEPRGQNGAVSVAMEGEANEAEGIPLRRAAGDWRGDWLPRKTESLQGDAFAS
jgi:hypothetical protein